MAVSTIQPNRGAAQVRGLLAQPEIIGLVADLHATRWTGRRGYPVWTMVGMVLVKSLYVLPTWTRTVALVAEHGALQAAVGCVGDVPSIDACYRFTKKLRAHKGLLDACVAAVIVALKVEMLRVRRQHRHRRLRPSRLRQRPAVPAQQEQDPAPEVLRS